MCVDEQRWIEDREFEDGIAAVNLLPGPASTQLTIFCAWRLRGPVGGITGGVCFILPGLILILALSAVFLARHPPGWILGAAAGAGAAVPAVALNAASRFVPASWKRIGTRHPQRARWVSYALFGGTAAATIGPYLVVVLVMCGLIEVAVRREVQKSSGQPALLGAVAGHAVSVGGFGALIWVALKVGALSYGGGFVIVPLMQHDAVSTYHWMTGAQFLNAVALGQVTPGPVVLTTSVVGYAARGLCGGLVATLMAFTPSFFFVILGGPRFDRIRSSHAIQSFLTGAGPAVIGAIVGSAIPLGLAFRHFWQIPLFVAALLWLFGLKRSVVTGLLLAGGIGVLLELSGVAV